MTSLFISHASSERRFVEQELVGLFRALGFEPWYAEENIASADGEDVRRFVADQERMMVAVKRGEEIYAKVPFRINQNHPHNDFRGRSYLPITIAYSQPRMDQGVVVEDYLVLYVGLEDVCGVTD